MRRSRTSLLRKKVPPMSRRVKDGSSRRRTRPVRSARTSLPRNHGSERVLDSAWAFMAPRTSEVHDRAVPKRFFRRDPATRRSCS